MLNRLLPLVIALVHRAQIDEAMKQLRKARALAERAAMTPSAAFSLALGD